MSYHCLLILSYSTISGVARYLLLLEYSKKFSLISAFCLVWNLLFEVFHDCGTSLFEEGSSMGLSLSKKIRSLSEPESNRTRTSFLFIVLVTELAVVTMLGSTPHHSDYVGGSALRWVFVRCNTIFLKLFTLLAWWRHHDVTSLANWCCAYIIWIPSDTSGGSFYRTRGSITCICNGFS